MKEYKCHKIVKAELMLRHCGYGVIEPTYLPPSELNLMSDDAYGKNYWEKGYRVIYEDGYESWSPKKAFEDGYTLICK